MKSPSRAFFDAALAAADATGRHAPSVVVRVQGVTVSRLAELYSSVMPRPAHFMLPPHLRFVVAATWTDDRSSAAMLLIEANGAVRFLESF